MLDSIGKVYTKRIQPNIKLIQIIFIPLIALVIPCIFQNKQSYCAYVMILMSSFWLLETLPMAVTSLFPILFFPLFGIMTSRETSSIYFQDILMLFLAVIVLTNAIKSSGLNEKLSLKILLLFGSDPKFLLFGIMFITWFLSIWISNNASVCMMMFPITVEIAQYLIKLNKSLKTDAERTLKKNIVSFEIEDSVEKIEFQEQSNQSLVHHESKETIESPQDTNEDVNILKAFCLSVTFSSTIGGSGSLIASPPNILLKGFLDEKYPNNGINFLTYILYSLPFTLVMLISSWIILCILYMPKNKFRSEKKIRDEKLNDTIISKYKNLEPLNWEQISVGVFFVLLILLWLTREVYWIKGWGYFFKKKFVTDTTPAIMIVVLLTIWPKENIFTGKEYKNLIDWKIINQSFPWNILLFAGGSFALAKGFEVSNLSNSIGTLLQKLMPFQKECALGLIVIMSEIGTEFTCNFSMSSILLPIVNSLAQKNNIDPFYLLIHTIMSINFSFMLPIATPSNSIVFASGHVKTRDMMITGGLLKLIGILVIFLFSSTWYNLIFDQILVINNLTSSNSTLITSIISNSTKM